MDTPSSNRLKGLDLARYMAFVGMVVVNFRIVMGAEHDGGLISLVLDGLQGRAAATFVVLAGIGLGLSAMKGRKPVTGPTIKRAMFLLLVGLLNMTVFDADIIHYYAFYFLIGVWFVGRNNWTLVAVIIILNVAFVLMVLTLDYDAGWNWGTYSYSDFWTIKGFFRNLFFNGWHPVVPWIGFLFVGFMLSRLSLGARTTQLRLFVGGVVTIGLSNALSLFSTSRLASSDGELAVFVGTEPVPPMPLYSLAGIGAACCIVGGCLLIAKPLERIRVLGIITPAGRQTLTLYIAHILIGMGSLEALGLLGGQSEAMAILALLSFCVAATLFALIWSWGFKYGPIESLMRKIAG